MTDQFVNNGGECELPELVKLINDELTAGFRDQSYDNLPVEKNEEQEDIGHHICIELAGKQLAIPLSAVLEAGELQIVQSLPLLPDWLTGITNIRGEIVSVVNLGFFLGRNKQSFTRTPSYIVVYNDEIKIAITVDRIIGTRSIYRPKNAKSDRGTNDILRGDYFAERAVYEGNDGEKEIALFDLNGFLSSDRLRNFATV